MKDLFPALDYFTQLAKTNRLAADNDFHPCLCSGPESIQGVMDSFKKHKNFIMVDDTTSQQTFGNGVGFSGVTSTPCLLSLLIASTTWLTVS